jgi:hypothetical protein
MHRYGRDGGATAMRTEFVEASATLERPTQSPPAS